MILSQKERESLSYIPLSVTFVLTVWLRKKQGISECSRLELRSIPHYCVFKLFFFSWRYLLRDTRMHTAEVSVLIFIASFMQTLHPINWPYCKWLAPKNCRGYRAMRAFKEGTMVYALTWENAGSKRHYASAFKYRRNLKY